MSYRLLNEEIQPRGRVEQEGIRPTVLVAVPMEDAMDGRGRFETSAAPNEIIAAR